MDNLKWKTALIFLNEPKNNNVFFCHEYYWAIDVDTGQHFSLREKDREQMEQKPI